MNGEYVCEPILFKPARRTQEEVGNAQSKARRVLASADGSRTARISIKPSTTPRASLWSNLGPAEIDRFDLTGHLAESECTDQVLPAAAVLSADDKLQLY